MQSQLSLQCDWEHTAGEMCVTSLPWNESEHDWEVVKQHLQGTFDFFLQTDFQSLHDFEATAKSRVKIQVMIGWEEKFVLPWCNFPFSSFFSQNWAPNLLLGWFLVIIFKTACLFYSHRP